MLEMIATGAAPSTIESLMIIFTRAVNPEAEIESLPHLIYIQNLRVVLRTVGEAIGVLQLSEFDNWDQLFTDAISIQRLLTGFRVWFHIWNHLKRGRVPMYLATPLLEIP